MKSQQHRIELVTRPGIPTSSRGFLEDIDLISDNAIKYNSDVKYETNKVICERARGLREFAHTLVEASLLEDADCGGGRRKSSRLKTRVVVEERKRQEAIRQEAASVSEADEDLQPVRPRRKRSAKQVWSNIPYKTSKIMLYKLPAVAKHSLGLEAK